jgi:hypothetical protein
MDRESLERTAYTPVPLSRGIFNPNARLPYGCEPMHIQQGMGDFLDFLGFINQQLNGRGMDRLESIMMQANFSSLVGEFMINAIAKRCASLVKNQHHNGHPDLLPVGIYPGDAVLHGREGIEIKASRYRSGWQGHNAETIWLLVFVFESSTPRDEAQKIAPRPFRFVSVIGALVDATDWSVSGRSAASRRTPTASILRSGYEKMMANWIYRSQD